MLVYILSKLTTLYLKKSLPVKNIDIASVNEQAALENADSFCLLFTPVSSRARTVSHVSSSHAVLCGLHGRELKVH